MKRVAPKRGLRKGGWSPISAAQTSLLERGPLPLSDRLTKSGSVPLFVAAMILAVAMSASEAVEVQELKLGEAIWRPSAGTMAVTAPDGSKSNVTADLWGLAIEQPARVVIRLQTISSLGLVIRALDTPTDKPLAILGPGQPFVQELPKGRYLLTVAGNRGGTNGAYLLSAALPPAAVSQFQGGLAEPQPGDGVALLGRYQLGPADGLAVGPGGQWVATWQGERAFLHQVAAGETIAVPTLGGPVKRLAFTAEGWALMAVTDQGALMLAMPELAPYARFTAQTGVVDAVPAPEHRIVLLPQDASAYVSSPIEGDLAYLPGTKGAAGLFGGQGSMVGLWYPDQQVQVFDSVARRELGRIRWPYQPASWSLNANEPIVAAAGPSTALWHAGATQSSALFGEASAVAYHPAGRVALATADGVLLATEDGQTTALQPTVQAIAVDINAAGHRLGALTAAGEVLLWDTISLLQPAAGASSNQLLAARSAYNAGLKAMKAMDFPTAREQFVKCRDLMADLPATGDMAEFKVLALLRLSQSSYLVKDYEASLTEADAYLAAARQLPDGDFKKYNVPQAIYRRADAQWELDRKDEARQGYQQALDAGLEGLAADDARKKVAE